MIAKIVILSALAIATNAQWQMEGNCLANIEVEQNFDVERYLGTWFEVSRIPHKNQQGSCAAATYGPFANGMISVLNREFVNDAYVSWPAIAELTNPNSTEAKLTVRFPSPDKIDNWILGTDYDNYAVVYACENVGIIHNVYAWVMARQKPLSQESMAKVSELLSKAGIIEGVLEENDLQWCKFEP